MGGSRLYSFPEGNSHKTTLSSQRVFHERRNNRAHSLSASSASSRKQKHPQPVQEKQGEVMVIPYRHRLFKNSTSSHEYNQFLSVTIMHWFASDWSVTHHKKSHHNVIATFLYLSIWIWVILCMYTTIVYHVGQDFPFLMFVRGNIPKKKWWNQKIQHK